MKYVVCTSRYDDNKKEYVLRRISYLGIYLFGFVLFQLSIGTNANGKWWWERRAGLRCAKNNNIEIDTMFTLEKCQARCLQTMNCTAVEMGVINVSWEVLNHTNCYASHGAKPLIDGDGTVKSCFSMTVDQCRSQCLLTPTCTGLEFQLTSNRCCLRSDIHLEKCERDAVDWNLHRISSSTSRGTTCNLHLGPIDLSVCDSYHETTDVYVLHSSLNPRPWWTTTHYAERAFMPRHYSCDPVRPNSTCTLSQLRALLRTEVKEQGYTVVNVDWPVESGPNSLYEGFGVKNYRNVDPLLGTVKEWHEFIDAAHDLVRNS